MGYDVIIVGAGEGGLFTGAILAKHGLKPLILEKKSFIGGRAMSTEYKPGYTVDWGIHSIRFGKKGMIPTIFRKELGIKLKLLDYGEGRLFRKGEWNDIPLSIKGFMTTPLLTKEERDIFMPLFMDIIRLKVEDYLDTSIAEYFKDKIQSENLWDLIRLIAAGLMVTPDIERASMGEFVDGIKQIITAGKGATYPEGGWKGIFEKLIEIISENGEIRIKSPVKKVLISDKKVQGILLEDGTEISSEIVIIAFPAQEMFSVLPEAEFSAEFISRCKNLIPSSGVSIDVGLKEKVSEDNGLIAVDDPMTLACFTSNVDPTTAPENEQLFTILQPVDKAIVEDPKQAKQIIERMQKLMQQMYPRIDKKIKWERILKLPVIDGAVNYIGQTRDKRPSVKSEVIQGLYFSGDTYNGPGLGGDIASSSALLCAHTLLKDLKKIPVQKEVSS